MVFMAPPMLAGCIGGGDDALEFANANGAFLPRSSYLQFGGDAARTGSVKTPGPSQFDIVLHVELPGIPASDAPPLFVDGAAYVLLSQYRAVVVSYAPPPDGTAEGLYRVDLEDGRADPVIELTDSPTTMASDGERFYVAEAGRLAAYAIDGTELWSWPFPNRFPDAFEVTLVNECVPPAIRDGRLYLACTQFAWYVDPDPSDLGQVRARAAFAVMLDLGDEAGPNREAWTWPPPDRGATLATTASGAPCVIPGMGERVSSVAVLGDKVLLTLAENPQDSARFMAPQYTINALGADDGVPAWVLCTEQTLVEFIDSSLGGDFSWVAPSLTGTSETAYVLHEDLWVVDLADGTIGQEIAVGSKPIHGPSPDNRVQGTWTETTGLALHDGLLFGQAYGDAFRIDLDYASVVWRMDVTNPIKGWGPAQPLVDDRSLFVAYPYVVAAFDAEDGGLRWRYDLDYHAYPTIGIADGFLALALDDATLTIIGEVGNGGGPSGNGSLASSQA